MKYIFVRNLVEPWFVGVRRRDFCRKEIACCAWRYILTDNDERLLRVFTPSPLLFQTVLFMMLFGTSRTAALVSCLAILSLLSRSAAFVFQRSLSPGYRGVIGSKHEVRFCTAETRCSLTSYSSSRLHVCAGATYAVMGCIESTITLQKDAINPTGVVVTLCCVGCSTTAVNLCILAAGEHAPGSMAPTTSTCRPRWRGGGEPPADKSTQHAANQIVPIRKLLKCV